MLLAVFNDGAMIALSKDRVVSSPTPNSWNLRAIFISGIVYGLYLTLSSWTLFFAASKTEVSLLSAAFNAHAWQGIMPFFAYVLHLPANWF